MYFQLTLTGSYAANVAKGITTITGTVTALSLIQPGEVKVDLANFDVKFRTKFLYVGFLKN
jgi:hypothetical protein